jgi:hypothetical protein
MVEDLMELPLLRQGSGGQAAKRRKERKKEAKQKNQAVAARRLKRIAQGFNPGLPVLNESALKVGPEFG